MKWFKKNNSKSDLRSKIRKNLKSLDFQGLIEKSGALNDLFFQFIQTHEKQIRDRVIVSFCPFENEPQINIERGENVDPYRVAYVRINDWGAREMDARYARRDLPGQWEEFTPQGGVQIFQPSVSQPRCDTKNIAIVLVPGLAFTREGERLGRGAGFYDRFLKICPEALWVGVALESQLVDAIPTESHDQKMNIILTEKKIIPTNHFDQWVKEGKIRNRKS